MREIKFRAWIPDGHWIENGMMYDWQDKIYTESVGFIPESEDGIKIMQYTGLKDRNGTEIYEGDVVEVDAFYDAIPHYPTDSETDNLIGLVKYVNGAWEADSVPLYVLFETGQPEIEVIGNIHEHSDLIK